MGREYSFFDGRWRNAANDAMPVTIHREFHKMRRNLGWKRAFRRLNRQIQSECAERIWVGWLGALFVLIGNWRSAPWPALIVHQAYLVAISNTRALQAGAEKAHGISLCAASERFFLREVGEPASS